MKKFFKKIAALLTVLPLLFSMEAIPAGAEAPTATAWLMYFASPSWWPQFQNMRQSASENGGIVAEMPVITGPGEYTAVLNFTDLTGEGALQFNLILDNAEAAFPGSCVKVTDLRINGVSVELPDNMYGIFNDKPSTGYVRLYNDCWDAAVTPGTTGPDASAMRAYDGVMDTEQYELIDPSIIQGAQKIEVDFLFAPAPGASEEQDAAMPADTLGEKPRVVTQLVAGDVQLPEDGASATEPTTAWLMFYDYDWWPKYDVLGADNPSGAVGAFPTITGNGSYTASLEFTQPWALANGIQQLNLVVEQGEIIYPECDLDITDIRIDGQPVEFKKNMYGKFHDTDSSFAPIYNEYWDTDSHPEATGPDLSTMRPGTDEYYEILDPSLISETSKIEIDFTITGGPEAVVAKPIWYSKNTVGVAALSLSDLGLADDWHNIVPVDLTKDGWHTYTLVGADAYIIGTACVAVMGDTVTVSCEYANGQLWEESQCIKWFTSLEDVTADALASTEGGLTEANAISIEKDLGGAAMAYLSINNKVTWRQPLNDACLCLPRYWRNMQIWKDYRASLMTMIEAAQTPAE